MRDLIKLRKVAQSTLISSFFDVYLQKSHFHRHLESCVSFDMFTYGKTVEIFLSTTSTTYPVMIPLNKQCFYHKSWLS